MQRFMAKNALAAKRSLSQASFFFHSLPALRRSAFFPQNDVL